MAANLSLEDLKAILTAITTLKQGLDEANAEREEMNDMIQKAFSGADASLYARRVAMEKRIAEVEEKNRKLEERVKVLEAAQAQQVKVGEKVTLELHGKGDEILGSNTQARAETNDKKNELRECCRKWREGEV